MTERLLLAIPGQWEKVIASALLLALAMLLTQLWSRYLLRSQISAQNRRMHLVWARNLIWFVTLLLIVSLWAATLAGFALSLAAVAGAMLLVSKELIMCVHGYLYVTLVQPFKVDDVIEFGALKGRVIDIDMFATTLAELDVAGRVTGNRAEFPNGLLLTTPLKNIAPTGDFALLHVRLPLPVALARDLEAIEGAALTAAERVTEPWREAAMAHFRKEALEHFIDFPSGKTQVSWDFSDPEHLVLVIRVACPRHRRSEVEQAVFRETWKALMPPVPA